MQTSSLCPGEGENGSAKDSWAICSLMNASDCGHAVRVYSHEVNASASATQPYRYDEQEKGTSFEAKEPCPSPRGSDSVGSATGSATKGESVAKRIYADENSTAEICAEVACFLGSHAEESESRTSGVVEVVTVSATADDGGAERVAGASHGGRGFCCAFRDVSHPPRAFLDDPSPVFLVPIFPSVLRDACVLHPAAAHVLLFLSSVFDAVPPASLC